MKIVDFRASARKLTFFISVKSGHILELACVYSYAEKSEKNIGAKFFDLSITVFELFTIEVFSFFLYVSINYLQNITSPCKKVNF